MEKKWSEYRRCNSSSYTITGVAAGMLKLYVVVTGTCGNVISSTVSLVLGNIVISNQPTTQTVCTGTNVTFSVTATEPYKLSVEKRRSEY
jgi:hypothetical protein